MNTIPFKTFPAFSEIVSLDRTSYLLTFSWNWRGQFWTMRVARRDGTVIAGGIKLVLNYELISTYPALDLPPGFMFPIDPGEPNVVSIGRDDMGVNVDLVYMSEAEVAAL